MTGPHDAESVAYWRHLAEQAQAEAALYRGMVGQMKAALWHLVEIYDGVGPRSVVYADLDEAFQAVRATLARTR
jgi:hypothetical protein